MRQRVITAIVALIIFIPIIIYGGFLIALAGAILASVGVYEMFKMHQLGITSLEGILSIIGAIFLVVPTYYLSFFLPKQPNNFILFYLIVMLILGISVISKNHYTIDEAGFPVLVSLYIGMGFQSFVNARDASLIILLYGLFVVWATDIGAYMIGRKYGKKKLLPAVSPNKTIEGAIGGVGSAIVIAFIFILITSRQIVYPYSLPVMLILTGMFSIIGQFGDLVESSIKRHYGVKDSGNILPGHGGILDRFDSLLFVFPIMHLLGIF
ncbi:phosphatidate cytidylyltransferase [Melissococcus plutonius]|uniref:Phosphatidate cytidylyltransferase n=1 Tax=Melissococcus plutonius TaxID=33970 RepID=A0A2Z5Y223_9ENTE|nr:phosphatidate cytidylyltransferase [Melissococcus plutonius]BAL61986.1 phosphatidate cytidylyltransferase [Melissococcus plutonius DAT561]MCV2499414.1 phosphatidate cytidylyltransferase [Melissococcus plutonius]MCV2500646.1 phosphatidate cytidylyltransferase [Melissococcus plutonius]MCV2505090.1 phosphatidate cytidylyltransferase [Melissococcus plutonius]MCV2507997.1 phosphatidate cytidylyltransferase [Melissococcus plutonius]